jgi:hypothetical protein
MPSVDQHTINVAAEITKQAIASSSSSLLSTPQTVTNFLTAMCEAITNLKEGMKTPRAPRL